MNHQPPPPATIAATTEVLELASLLDNRIATPDKARIMAWARQIDRHHLERDDLLDATQSFYDRPSAQPVAVGDVIEAARRIKRDHLDREADAAREARQADNDAKAEALSIAAAVEFGQARKRTPDLDAAERALQSCTNRAEAMGAIRAFFDAKHAARKADR